MKKIINICLSILLVLTLISVKTVNADNQGLITISVDDNEIKYGDTLRFVVSISQDIVEGLDQYFLALKHEEKNEFIYPQASYLGNSQYEFTYTFPNRNGWDGRWYIAYLNVHDGINRVSFYNQEYYDSLGYEPVCNYVVDLSHCDIEVRETKPLTSIRLNKNTLILQAGENQTLTPTYNPEDTTDSKTLVWKSEDTSVATVDENGKVTGIAAGNTIVTATTVNNYTATCLITVTKPSRPITSVTLNKEVITLEKGTSTILQATILPTNTTSTTGLTWSSSNTSIASVFNGVVDGVEVGTTTITVKTSNGKTDACIVRVVDGVSRIYGEDRYKTSQKVSEEVRSKVGKPYLESIIIASGESFADALAGSFLAKKTNSPILMTGKYDYQIEDTIDYVKDNVLLYGTVYILGGEAVVPKALDEELSRYRRVVRLAGDDRYETNLEILKEAHVYNEEILVCTGTNFADSLSASATGLPILLLDHYINEEQQAFLSSLNGNKITVIGGENAVPKWLENELKKYSDDVTRVAGNTRYETSTLLAERYFENPTYAYVAYGLNFPDGLSGGPLAQIKNTPLILTNDEYYNYSITKSYMNKYNIHSGCVLGGQVLISDHTVRSIFDIPKNEEIKVK